MKAVIRKIVSIGLFAYLAGTNVPEASSAQLSIVSENFPPYNYSQNGEAKGLSAAVVLAVMDEIDLKVPIQFLPWARSYQMAQEDKNTLIFSIARIPEREELFHWVGEIAPYRTSFYKLKSKTNITVNSLADARRYVTGVSIEDVIYTYLKGKGFVHLDIAGRDILSIRKLASGRLDLVAFDEASFAYRVFSEQLNPADFERVLRLDELTGALYMAFSKDTDISLVEKFKQGLATIKENGVFDTIQSRYLLY